MKEFKTETFEELQKIYGDDIKICSILLVNKLKKSGAKFHGFWEERNDKKEILKLIFVYSE